MCIVAIAGLIGYVASSHILFIRIAEAFLTDLRLYGLSRPIPQSEAVVIIGIDEKSLSRFPYRSPVDREFVANLVQTLDKAGARAIGVDILLDQPTEADKDRKLYRALRETRAPVVMAWAEAPDSLTSAQIAFLDEFTKGLRRGSVALTASASVVRWTVSVGSEGEIVVRSFASELALAAGYPAGQSAFEIAYRHPTADGTRSIKVYPAHLAASLPRHWIAGKIVIIGANLAHDDAHLTPYWAAFGIAGGTMQGSEVHAHALDQIVEGRNIPVAPAALTLSIFAGMALAGAAIAALPVSAFVVSILGLSCFAISWILAAAAARLGLPTVPILGPSLGYLIALALSGLYTSMYVRGHARFLRYAFSRYVAESVVDRIARADKGLELGGERRELTFIFTDVAGFTTLSERTPPKRLIPLLNEYLDGMTAIILDHGGTMDKFVGDAVVCFFGAPENLSDHAVRGIDCAIALDAFARQFARAAKRQEIAFGLTRIGVHSGDAVVGNFGGSKFFDYTAIGDTVNTAARIEGLNKLLGTTLAVSETTAELTPHMSYRGVGTVVLKGKDQGLQIFVPFNGGGQDAPKTAYDNAFLSFAVDPAASLQAFTKLQRDYPEDALVAFQIRRLQNGVTNPEIIMTDK